MAKREGVKNFAPSVQGEDRHRHLMQELNRIMRYLFEDEPKLEHKKEVGDNGR